MDDHSNTNLGKATNKRKATITTSEAKAFESSFCMHIAQSSLLCSQLYNTRLCFRRTNVLSVNKTLKLSWSDQDSANIAHRLNSCQILTLVVLAYMNTRIRKKVSNSVDLTISILIHIQKHCSIDFHTSVYLECQFD